MGETFKKNVKKVKKQKEDLRRVTFKLLANTFVMLCVVVASVQNLVYIPVFSDYFSPPTSTVAEVAISDKPYISSVTYYITEDSSEKILYLTVNINEHFDNYESYFVEYVNIESGIEGHSLIQKEYGGTPIFVKTKTYPYYSAKYKIYIYISSLHPEDLTYESTMIRDEITYYLVYTHAEIINI